MSVFLYICIQVWPNLAASAITGACVVVYHNRHLRKVRDELKQHLGVDDDA